MLLRILLVIACHFVHMMSSGISLSFGVLFREIRLDFGASYTEAAWIASIYNGALGFVGIPLGFIVNRVGERWPTICGSLLLSIGMLSSMFVTSIHNIYVTYSIIAGLGAGINHYCAYTVISPHFNDRWRPVAVMLASAGVPMATLVLPPILTVFIETYGWRKAFMFLACLSVFGVPAGFIFYKPNDPNSEVVNTELNISSNYKRMTASRFLKNLNFVLYSISAFLTILIMFVPSTFLPDLMRNFGRSSKDVYICLMTMGAADFSARLLFGFIIQQIPSKLPFIGSAGAMLLCVSSCLITLSSSPAMYAFFTGLIGFSIGICCSLVFYMAVHLLAPEDVKVGYGLVLTLGGFAMVAGMPIAGYVVDVSGTERGAFIFTGVVICISSGLDLIIGIKERFEKRSSNACDGQSKEVNSAYIENENIQSEDVANNIESPEQTSYI